MTVKDAFIGQGSRYSKTWKSTTVHLRYKDLPCSHMNHNGTSKRGKNAARICRLPEASAASAIEQRWLIDVVAKSLGDRPQIFLNRGGEICIGSHHPRGQT